MERDQGYYSLVQFCPDPGRAEVANVGVLLFCPKRHFIGVKVAPGNERIRTIFPWVHFDDQQLDAMKTWFRDRIAVERDRFRALADLAHFAATRFNEMRLTAPRSIVVEEPESQLDQIFRELVELPPTHSEHATGQQENEVCAENFGN